MTVKQFGESEAEIEVKDKIKAREITQTVMEYGVNQKQIAQMIYLLAMELEDHDLMRAITSTITQSREGTSSTIITGE